MHLKRTHLVSAASFFPNSISRPYNYLSPLSFSDLAHCSVSLSPGLLYWIPGAGIYTVMSSMTREMQISAEILRGIPVRNVSLCRSIRRCRGLIERRIVNIYINIRMCQSFRAEG